VARRLEVSGAGVQLAAADLTVSALALAFARTVACGRKPNASLRRSPLRAGRWRPHPLSKSWPFQQGIAVWPDDRC